ncbi:MAG: ATP12 family protein [Pseudomonadota bacterium]
MDKAVKPKRFYKSAGVELIDGAWTVVLDGRVVKTPAKAALALPTRSLAAAVAEEWDAQGETLDLQAMTLTRLANVALDRTPETRVEMVSEIARYGETDLTCYLAENPSELQARQDVAWRPWRDWAGETLGVVLVPVYGIVASPQPQASLDAIISHAETLDDLALTGLAWACSLFGSAVLALALENGAISAEVAFKASLVDEDWQIEQWGEDEEAMAARAGRERDAKALGLWFQALKTTSGA